MNPDTATILCVDNDESILKALRRVLSHESRYETKSGVLGGIPFSMQCIPLSGSFKGHGAVLVFQQI